MLNISKFFTMCFALILCIVLFNSIITRKISNLRTDIGSFTASEITLADREKQLDCLTKNIYWEAAGESFEGKVAVAQVTLNRSKHKSFAKGICEVVYQKNVFYEKVICQFSWYCETNHKIRPINKSLYEESYKVAKKVLLEGFKLDILDDALFYHAIYVNPKWNKQKITQIGQHIFYKI